MTRIPFPATRPRAPQTEVCNLCAREVHQSEGSYCEVIGPLYGLFVCQYHGDLVTEPSWLDLRGADDTVAQAADEAVREQPFGMQVWWDGVTEAPVGYLLREDGDYIYRETGTGTYIARESAP